MVAALSQRNAIIFLALNALFNCGNAQTTLPNVASSATSEQCIPANTFVPLPATLVGQQTDVYGKTSVALGSYERISPDGRFVLRSFSGGRLGEVSLVELNAAGQVVAAYNTPLSNEAFPVQGSWRYLVDVNGDHYPFSSVLRAAKGAKPQPVFRGGMTGFYAAASELPASSADAPGVVRIRSMSWPNANAGADNQGEGALVARTLHVDTTTQRIVADSGFTSLCTQRVREDGPLYALPMISVDGQEFAALPQTPVKGEQTMRIFAFGSDGKGCEPRAAFSFSSGKTIFGYPQGPLAADLAYEYQSQVWWVHRGQGMGVSADTGGTGRPFNIALYDANPRNTLLASAFPGITRDGRVIYGAVRKTCPADTAAACTEQAGYVITDPFQSNAYQQFLQQHKGPARRQCITQGDVTRERAAFAKLHGLTLP